MNFSRGIVTRTVNAVVEGIDLYLKAIDMDPVAYAAAYFNLALLSAHVTGSTRPSVT